MADVFLDSQANLIKSTRNGLEMDFNKRFNLNFAGFQERMLVLYGSSEKQT